MTENHVTSVVKYLGSLRTEATHMKSGQKIITDAPVDNHGLGQFFSPTDLAATSLASCMMTIMGIAADHHNITLTDVSASVVKVMASNPRRIAKIKIIITIGDPLNEKEQMILEKAALNCPVALSLHPDIIREIHFEYRK